MTGRSSQNRSGNQAETAKVMTVALLLTGFIFGIATFNAPAFPDGVVEGALLVLAGASYWWRYEISERAGQPIEFYWYATVILFGLGAILIGWSM